MAPDVFRFQKDSVMMAEILVVEDVPAVLYSLRIILTGAGYRVSCVADGAAGLEMLKAAQFDLIISDIWMPGMSGTDVIAQGRRLAPRARFLAITGGNPNSGVLPDDLIGSEFGADAVLHKPFEKDDLIATVSALLKAAPSHG
jgi:CheY-like chemotaxis protein